MTAPSSAIQGITCLFSEVKVILMVTMLNVLMLILNNDAVLVYLFCLFLITVTANFWFNRMTELSYCQDDSSGSINHLVM